MSLIRPRTRQEDQRLIEWHTGRLVGGFEPSSRRDVVGYGVVGTEERESGGDRAPSGVELPGLAPP
jgi:hypothetical protein